MVAVMIIILTIKTVWAEPWNLLVWLFYSNIPTLKMATWQNHFSVFLRGQSEILIIENCSNQLQIHNDILILYQKSYRMTTVTISLSSNTKDSEI